MSTEKSLLEILDPLAEQAEKEAKEKRKGKPIEAFYEKPKKQYWYRSHLTGEWIPAGKDPVLEELEQHGWKTKPEKGKCYSDADGYIRDVRAERSIEFAGAVAGHLAGLKTYKGKKILITEGPNLIEPKKGDWEKIKTLGDRLFPGDQFKYVLGWSQNAVKGIYLEEHHRRGQMLVLAGPSGVGKTFWQERIVTPMLGDRMAKPIQFMTGGTTFNADLISCEHLMLSDEISKTDMKSRQAFGTAIKNFTVNPSQRFHGKGDNGFVVDSSHWITMSINDDVEALAILPPLEYGVRDKLILLKCGEGITNVWPGPGSEPKAELQKQVECELAAFIYYLLNEHAVTDKGEGYDRHGVESYKHPVIVDQINGMSSGSHLEFLIDSCWDEVAKKGGLIKMKSDAIRLQLTSHPTLGRPALALLYYERACGKYLNELAEINPKKYTPPAEHARGDKAVWTIDWSE